MTYDELLEFALKRQHERDQWEKLAMGWKEIALGRGRMIEELEGTIKKPLDPTLND